MDDVINPGAGAAIQDTGIDSGGYDGALDGNEPVNGPAQGDTPAAPPTAEPATAKPETGQEQQLEYVYQGKKISIPLTKAVLKLQQAHVLDEKFRALNEQQAKLETDRTQWEQLVNKYKPVDEWATKNDELFQRIITAYQREKELQGLPPDVDLNEPGVKVSLQLAERLNQLEEQIRTRQQQEQLKAQEAENAKAKELLDQQIGQVRQEFPEINLDATDEAGMRLESAVIRHGLDNNLPFREAFLSLFYKDLLKIAAERGAKSTAENIKRKNELGIVSTGGATRKEAPKRTDFKGVSWDTLIQEAKQEYLGR